LAVWTEWDGCGCRATCCVNAGGLSGRVYFFDEDVVLECLGEGLIEAGEQLGQCLALAAHEHGQGVVLIAGHGDAADGVHFAEGDFAVVDELGDVRQGEKVDHGVAVAWPLLYAAAWFAGDRLGETFPGSNSSMRVMG
jgi:hypothetical protein